MDGGHSTIFGPVFCKICGGSIWYINKAGSNTRGRDQTKLMLFLTPIFCKDKEYLKSAFYRETVNCFSLDGAEQVLLWVTSTRYFFKNCATPQFFVCPQEYGRQSVSWVRL